MQGMPIIWLSCAPALRAIAAVLRDETHPIDEASPLWGQTPESLAEQGAELQVSVSGMDDTWMQAVHASHTYYDLDLVWGARHADILRDEGAVMTLDLAKFDDLEPTEPTAAFPYPRVGR